MASLRISARCRLAITLSIPFFWMSSTAFEVVHRLDRIILRELEGLK